MLFLPLSPKFSCPAPNRQVPNCDGPCTANYLSPPTDDMRWLVGREVCCCSFALATDAFTLALAWHRHRATPMVCGPNECRRNKRARRLHWHGVLSAQHNNRNARTRHAVPAACCVAGTVRGQSGCSLTNGFRHPTRSLFAPSHQASCSPPCVSPPAR